MGTDRRSTRVGSIVRVSLFILLGFLIFVDVVWTIARVADGHVPQALLGVAFLVINCTLVIASVKAKS